MDKKMSEDEIEYYTERLNEAVEIVMRSKCRETGREHIIAAIVFLKIADVKR